MSLPIQSRRLNIKGKAFACMHEFFKVVNTLGVKFISLSKLLFAAPDHQPPRNNSASMNTIRFYFGLIGLVKSGKKTCKLSHCVELDAN